MALVLASVALLKKLLVIFFSQIKFKLHKIILKSSDSQVSTSLKQKKDPINITISCHKPGENILEKMCEAAANKKDVRPSICFVDQEQIDNLM